MCGGSNVVCGEQAKSVARLPGMWQKLELPFVTEDLLRKVFFFFFLITLKPRVE